MKNLACHLALTPEMIEACYHLRHRVYAEERPWEAMDMAELEIDRYDRKSAHVVVLWHDRPVATARLCPGPELPLSKYLPCYPLPDGAMEIGRLCIPSPKTEKLFPRTEVMKCLADGFESLRRFYRRRPVYALMRPALQRVLVRAGYGYGKVGPVIDCDGIRYLMKYDDPEIPPVPGGRGSD